jgi:hypothetical protein
LFRRARTSSLFFPFLGNNIVGWVAGVQGTFRPDIVGLADEHWRTALEESARWPDNPQPGAWFLRSRDYEDWHGFRHLCWQIAWTVSRGGLRGLVPCPRDSSARPGHHKADRGRPSDR